MREVLRDASRLRHMVEAMDNIFCFMEGKNVQDLSTNAMLFYAVVKNIEIIGEAAYKLSHEFVEKHPVTPWRQIIAMRHILVHGYYQIEAEQLYNFYTEDLPLLRPQLQAYLYEAEKTDQL